MQGLLEAINRHAAGGMRINASKTKVMSALINRPYCAQWPVRVADERMLEVLTVTASIAFYA